MLTKCGRCEEVAERVYVVTYVDRNSHHNSIQRLPLCPPCMTKFEDFFKIGIKQNARNTD